MEFHLNEEEDAELTELISKKKDLNLDEEQELSPTIQGGINLLFCKRLFKIISYCGISLMSSMLCLNANYRFSYLGTHLYLWTMLLLGLLISLLSVLNAQWLGLYVTYMTGGKSDLVWKILYQSILYGLGICICSAWTTYCGYLISWHWQNRLTQNVLKICFGKTILFHILSDKKNEVDNFDQRVVSDISDFCDAIKQILVGLSQKFFLIIFLTIDLVNATGWFPALMTYVIVTVILLGMKFVLSKLSSLLFQQDCLEGNFRYAHARIRTYAESISFFKGEEIEKNIVNERFDDVIGNSKSIAKWNFVFSLYIQFTGMVPAALAGFILCFYYWNQPGSFFGQIITGATQIVQTIYGIQALVLLGRPFSVLVGSVGRVGQLLELCEYYETNLSSFQPEFQEDTSNSKITLWNVTCYTPKKTTLGPSGSGKSSLLKSLCGHWLCDGIIKKPKNGIFFLPQKPYFSFGTLKDQIIYPEDQNVVGYVNEEELLNCLKMANIEHIYLQKGLHNRYAWETILSPGEQQRLQMARLFYHKPTFAVLDESTSALDSRNEEMVYGMCETLGITLISVAHRKSVKKFHDKLLLLDGKGSYEILQLDPNEDRFDKKNWRLVIDRSQEKSQIHSREVKEDIDDEIRTQDTMSESYFTHLVKILKISHPNLLSISTIFVIVILVTSVVLAFESRFLSMGSKKVLDAFSAKDMKQFILSAILELVIMLLVTVIHSLNNNICDFLGIHYRDNLVRYVHDHYFQNGLLLSLNTNEKLDNVDQRIGSDITKSVSGFPTKTGIPIFLSVFILKLIFQGFISPLISFIFTSTLEGGGIYLSLMCFSVILPIILLMGPLLTWISEQTIVVSNLEGDYRFSVIKIREFIDEVSFFGEKGFESERKNLLNNFSIYMDAKWKIYVYQSLLSILYSLGSLIDTMVATFILINFHITGYVLRGVYAFGILQQLKTMTVIGLHQSFQLAQTLPDFSTNRGYVGRTAQLIDEIERIKEKKMIQWNQTETWKVSDGRIASNNSIKLDNVVCSTPTDRILNKSPYVFSVEKGDRLLIMGPSGSGKTSLFRVISGLWVPTHGHIDFNVTRLLFMPQNPYLVLGSLRDQVIYPTDHYYSDEDITHFLKEANLGSILEKYELDSIENWSEVLSPGERQRLSFARLFAFKPEIVFLDEATSALDSFNESELYGKCIEMNIIVISIAHADSALEFHNKLLKLDANGGWTMSIEDSYNVEDI